MFKVEPRVVQIRGQSRRGIIPKEVPYSVGQAGRPVTYGAGDDLLELDEIRAVLLFGHEALRNGLAKERRESLPVALALCIVCDQPVPVGPSLVPHWDLIPLGWFCAPHPSGHRREVRLLEEECTEHVLTGGFCISS